MAGGGTVARRATVEHRPLYHLHPRAGWVNDPNGPVQLGDTYHLFCQYNPHEPVHGNVHWAHFTSTNLVRWQAHPPALLPSPGGPDADGCWSGSAVVVDGEPWLVYSGYRAELAHQDVCLARPGPDGRWVKDARNPVQGAPPGVASFRDPFVTPADGGGFIGLVGAELADGVPAVLTFRCPDLHHWQYAGIFCSARDSQLFDHVRVGNVWECPHLARFDGRGLLIVSVWCSEPRGPDSVLYVTGRLLGDRLEPAAVDRFDAGPDFYAPALTRDAAGRYLLWGWSPEARSARQVRAEGWAGALTLPRVLTLGSNDRPRITPAAELVRLRGAERRWTRLALAEGGTCVLDPGLGDAYEVEAALNPVASGRCWLALRRTPGGEEQVLVSACRDATDGRVVVELSRERASLDGGAAAGSYRVPAAADPGSPVRLRIFVDRSIVEVFVDDTRTITARVYPTRPDSSGLAVGASGGPAYADVRCWQIRTSAFDPPAR